MNCRNKKGVTLAELVVVMAIIAIGAVLVAPNIGAWIPSYRLRGATREVVSQLRTAQMKAISTNREYRVSFDVSGNFVLQYRNTGVWFNEGAAMGLPTGVTIAVITFPGRTAQFNPDSSASTGSITLRNIKGSEKTITLTTSTGRVHVND